MHGLTALFPTAHRPTFDPAKGKEAQRGPAYHQRLLPAHTQLKTRQPGQGGDADGLAPVRDLRAQLLEAEAAHFKKTNPEAAAARETEKAAVPLKRELEDVKERGEEEDLETKRRRILEETRDVDAASEDEDEESSEEESDDEDEEAELLRELEKIKRERAEKKEQEVSGFCSLGLGLGHFTFGDVSLLTSSHRSVRRRLSNRTSERKTLLLEIPYLCQIETLIPENAGMMMLCSEIRPEARRRKGSRNSSTFVTSSFDRFEYSMLTSFRRICSDQISTNASWSVFPRNDLGRAVS